MKHGGIKLKKPYSKPTMAFQNMFLATSVNTACTFTAEMAFDSCKTYIEDWGEYVFDDTDVSTGCNIGYVDFPCYHIPMESSNVFES